MTACNIRQYSVSNRSPDKVNSLLIAIRLHHAQTVNTVQQPSIPDLTSEISAQFGNTIKRHLSIFPCNKVEN